MLCKTNWDPEYDQIRHRPAGHALRGPAAVARRGRYQDDLTLPGQAYAVFLRSPHAHARIRAVDTAAAEAMPGVLAVYTGADLAADGLGTMAMRLQRKRPDGSPMFARRIPALARDRVRYVGDPVAMVVAESAGAGEGRGRVRRRRLRAAAVGHRHRRGGKPGAPPVWDECPDNVSHVFEAGDKAATEAAFARAAHVVKRRYVITRVHAQYMEPRGAIGAYDPGEDRYTLYADVQYPHRVRNMLAANIFKVPESKVRVVAGDVGGGFGTKGWQYVEHRLMLWAARKLGRPVKWTLRAQRGDPGRRARPRRRRRRPSWRSTPTARFLGAARCTRIANHRRLSRRPTATCCRPSPDRHAWSASMRSRRPMSRSPASSSTPTRPRPIAAPAGRRRSTSSSG